MYRIIKVKSATCIAKPSIVGQPLLDIVPTKLDNNELVKLYVHGLNIKTKTKVVYKVNLHLSEAEGDAIIELYDIFFNVWVKSLIYFLDLNYKCLLTLKVEQKLAKITKKLNWTIFFLV
jgi:hypothetical protein